MDYQESLEQAITYIEENLGGITVEDVAQKVGYSYYHFTRLFNATLGESVGSYIKKRRLADGARKLLYTEKRVIDIAMENGFESSEAFSRAFKSLYKVSPITYRNNRLDTIVTAKHKIDNDLLRHISFGMTIKPRIVEIDDIKVAGLRCETTLRDNVIPELWQRFTKIIDTIPNKAMDARTFGICECSPSVSSIYSMNKDALFHEVASVEVSSFDGIPDSVVKKTIIGGKYAVFTHKGSLVNLKKTFDYIWSTWMIGSRVQIDDREDFELYDDRFKGYYHPDSELDIYIPIRPLRDVPTNNYK